MGVDICQDIKSGTLQPKRPAQTKKEHSAPTDRRREGGCGQTLETFITLFFFRPRRFI